MNAFLSLPPATLAASRRSMRVLLLTFFLALAVVWCSIGDQALACTGDTSNNAPVASGIFKQATAKADGDREKPASVPQQAVAHHHCCMAAPTAPLPFSTATLLAKAPLGLPADSPAMLSFAQAPPTQPPAA